MVRCQGYVDQLCFSFLFCFIFVYFFQQPNSATFDLSRTLNSTNGHQSSSPLPILPTEPLKPNPGFGLDNFQPVFPSTEGSTTVNGVMSLNVRFLFVFIFLLFFLFYFILTIGILAKWSECCTSCTLGGERRR